MIFPALAEEERTLVQEQVPLHGFEACKLLHPCRAPFMTDPHAEGTLHQDSAQIAQITLPDTHTNILAFFFLTGPNWLIIQKCVVPPQHSAHLISSDGNLVHRIIDRFEQVQHGSQCTLQLGDPLTTWAVLQQLLDNIRTYTHVQIYTLRILYILYILSAWCVC